MPLFDAGAAAGPDLRQISVDGCEILLARVDGCLHATAARCPHAGAPLAEGILHDGTITCPWHKAAFDVRTGASTAPPAVDPLPTFRVHVEHGRVMIRLPGAIPTPKPQGPDPRCFALIGAGAAGAAAAQTLREQGFGGRLVLISPEPDLPYDRTLLSKYALSGARGGEKSPLQSAYFYHRHRIERRLATVTAIDPAARLISFAGGETMAYDAALLAPGGIARRPQIGNADLPGLFTLRSAADTAAILEQARHAQSCVVLGAGFIGMEAAAALAERGLHVTVVAPQSVPFESQLGAEVGNALAGLHRARGIAFRLNRQAVALIGEERVTGVILDDGEIIDTGLVIAGLGIAPNTAMLPPQFRADDGSVAVDSTLRLTDTLYAAGDIAGVPLYGCGPPIRVEHWRVAQQHGRAAALNMLGEPARYSAVPYFWTIHFRKRLDYVGYAKNWDHVIIDGGTEPPDFLAYYVAGGMVRAVAGIGRDLQMAACLNLFAKRQDWPADDLRAALQRA